MSTIFAENLRTLTTVKGDKDLIKTCAALGISKQQLQKYLDGAMTPRSDVLYRITRHFNVDARILFSPLSDLEGDSQNISHAFSDILHLPARVLTVDPRALPGGYYLEWRASATDVNKVSASLMRVQHHEDTSHFSGIEWKHNLDAGPGTRTTARFHGNIHQYETTLSVIRHAATLQDFSFSVLHHSSVPARNHVLMVGVNIQQPRDVFFGGKNQVMVVWEKLADTFTDIMKAKRQIGDVPLSEIHPLIQNMLQQKAT